MLKLTMIYQVDQATPTESWFFSQYSNPNDPDTQAALIQVINARAAMLAFPALIIGARLVSSDAPRYGIYLKSGTYVTGGNFLGGCDRDYSSVVWVAQVFGNRIARRYLAGAPDSVIGNLVGNVRGYQQSAGWQGLFDAYVAQLVGNQAQVRSNISSNFDCLAVVTAAQFPGLIGVQVSAQITFDPPFFSPAGSPTVKALYLKGFRSLNPRAPGLHGAYKVAGEVPPTSPASTPWTYYLYKTDSVNPANIEVRGQVGALEFEPLNVLAGSITQATHHKRGGRAFLPVGRSKTRA